MASHERYPPIHLELETRDDITAIKSILSTNEAGGLAQLGALHIFPARHHVIAKERMEEACLRIEEEVKDRVSELTGLGKLVKLQRIQERVILNDPLLLQETGFCSGAENDSRHLAAVEMLQRILLTHCWIT